MGQKVIKICISNFESLKIFAVILKHYLDLLLLCALQSKIIFALEKAMASYSVMLKWNPMDGGAW